MKAIMLSVQPEWVEKILNGEKTIEIRKTKPSCGLPVKVYIYCTKNKPLYKTSESNEYLEYYSLEHWHKDDVNVNGKVVAEFTLKEVEEIKANEIFNADVMEKEACLTVIDVLCYTQGKDFYGWHISDLKIYDKPKELSEFMHRVPDYSNGVVCYSLKQEPLKRPPQSWCYVEELEDKDEN